MQLELTPYPWIYSLAKMRINTKEGQFYYGDSFDTNNLFPSMLTLGKNSTLNIKNLVRILAGSKLSVNKN